jgi:hypothetical protein
MRIKITQRQLISGFAVFKEKQLYGKDKSPHFANHAVCFYLPLGLRAR